MFGQSYGKKWWLIAVKGFFLDASRFTAKQFWVKIELSIWMSKKAALT